MKIRAAHIYFDYNWLFCQILRLRKYDWGIFYAASQTNNQIQNGKENKKRHQNEMSFLSGRADLNRRPHGPEPCALAGLSYAPMEVIIIQAIGFWQGEIFWCQGKVKMS